MEKVGDKQVLPSSVLRHFRKMARNDY